MLTKTARKTLSLFNKAENVVGKGLDVLSGVRIDVMKANRAVARAAGKKQSVINKDRSRIWKERAKTWGSRAVVATAAGEAVQRTTKRKRGRPKKLTMKDRGRQLYNRVTGKAFVGDKVLQKVYKRVSERNK